MRERTGHTPTRANAPEASLIAMIAVGFALVVALLVVPLAAYGQSGPLRDQGLSEPGRPTDPTPTARMFQASGDAPESAINSSNPPGSAIQAQTLRPGQASNPEPSRRPRPDPAPVVLLPTVAPAPPAEPAAAPRTERARTRSAPPPAPSRIWPVAMGTYEISQPFGCVPQLLGYYPVVSGCPAAAPAYHTGLDFAAEEGTPIYAAASGWVTIAGQTAGSANTQLVIHHDGVNDGYTTEYYHWIRTYVRPGDYVSTGDLIADVGSVGYSTGPHLHFTVVDTRSGQQLDPADWLPASASTVAATNPANPANQTNPSSDGVADSHWERGAGGGIVVVDYIELDPTPTPAAPRR